MGRRPISNKAGTFVCVTLPPELLAALDKHARKMAGPKGTPSRTKAIRALLAGALKVPNVEDEKEFG